MIRLINLEIDNFRSIISTTLQIEFSNITSVIGPNNSGKSNILRALQLFFNGKIDNKPYTADLDYPKNSSLSPSKQTKITVTISYEPHRETIINNAIQELENNSGQQRLDNNQVRLRLSYSKKGIESWQFIGRGGARNISKELINKVRDAVRSSVRFKYIPVGRDIKETIYSELSDELIRTIFSGWSGQIQSRQAINNAIQNLIMSLEPKLNETSNSITHSINDAFQEIQNLSFSLPFNDLESMLPSLSLNITDNYETGLTEKGAGIQTSSLIFLLKYLADNHPQRHNSRVTFFWAIEEPESYLHPARQKNISSILNSFSSEVQTIITTHSPHFVPRTNKEKSYIIEKSNDEPYSTMIIGQDYELARNSLGVTLLDSMYLQQINIVVEGPSDEIVLRNVIEKAYSNSQLNLDPTEIKFFPSGNAQSACYLYESLRYFGDSDQTNIYLIIDGDDAGRKALNGLINRLRNISGITIKANKDYFQLPIDVENLTPRRIIEILEQERPAQVQVNRDTNSQITFFKILDSHKKAVARRIGELIQEEELNEYLTIFKTIESLSQI
ncbi:MAG: AAA family ATPase [Candidatus Zhuqueibacterota bacterium]